MKKWVSKLINQTSPLKGDKALVWFLYKEHRSFGLFPLPTADHLTYATTPLFSEDGQLSLQYQTGRIQIKHIAVLSSQGHFWRGETQSIILQNNKLSNVWVCHCLSREAGYGDRDMFQHSWSADILSVSL